MTAKPLYVGIDLGTTNSTAAVFDGERVHLIRNSQGSPLTPSVVRFDARGVMTVGTRARRFLESDPQNTRTEFKRLMGTAQAIEFPAAKLSRRPEELSAAVLASLRADVEQQYGIAPARAVIAVPALFELPQSSATSEAARLGGFERAELIQEPVASALAAGWTQADTTGKWLIYDLGGGTFDVSLLETRDEMLRVVGHDGDNFLGGRDVDLGLVDWAIEEIARAYGVRLARSEPRHAAALRRLKAGAEEAKIELSRAPEAAIALPGLIEEDGRTVDADLVLTRAVLEAVCTPLVEKSLAVCRRLLAAHRLEPGQLSRVVLVGGPTMMPFLRARVRAALAAELAEGLDPMTLVAQGAAIYAATAGLDARPATPAAAAAHLVLLRYPAVSTDLTPHVVGRLVERAPAAAGKAAPARVRLLRADGLWQSPAAEIDDDGAFILSVELVPRRPNVFTLEVKTGEGADVPVAPALFTIVQGLTVTDPPLSRSIGVALANDVVRVYFERGAPLPARRTVTHHTVEGVAKGYADCLLKIPVVQGEFAQAHLCRLVGTLEIGGAALSASLPAGAQVDVTLEVDRGGRLTASAFVPVLNQVFEQVAHLLLPVTDPALLEANLEALARRIGELRGDAGRRGDDASVARLAEAGQALEAARADLAAARGGDADAGQKAQRALIEVDATIEEVEAEKRWPELDLAAKRRLGWAAVEVAAYGTPAEERLLHEVEEAMERARTFREALELERQMRVLLDLGNAAFYRNPDAWKLLFENAASKIETAKDLPKAQRLVQDGHKALARNDTGALKEIVKQLWDLMPADAQDRRLGFDSGVQ